MDLHEQFEEILKQHVGDCTCDEAYKSRQMCDPNCAWCNEHEGMLDAMQVAYDLGRTVKLEKIHDLQSSR